MTRRTRRSKRASRGEGVARGALRRGLSGFLRRHALDDADAARDHRRPATDYANPDKYAVDGRGLAYSYAYIALKRLGAGQYYLINIKDKDGDAYDGAKTYHLHVPPNAPVQQYWSVTAYDRETHALIKGVDRASRASNAADVEKNADGSVDIWFGPKAPEGKESNWVPTDPNRRFELMFRFYAPTKALFDKAWTLPDVEKVGARGRLRSLAETAGDTGGNASDDKARGPDAFEVEPRAPEKRQARPSVDDPGDEPADQGHGERMNRGHRDRRRDPRTHQIGHGFVAIAPERAQARRQRRRGRGTPAPA